MKKILLGLILLAVLATLFSIGYMTGTNTEPEAERKTNTEANTKRKTDTAAEKKSVTGADSISESVPPSKNLSTDSSSADNNSGKFAGIFGEWVITDTIGTGYIFSSSYPEEDYIGGRIVIHDELVQCSFPNEEWNFTVKNPKFVMQWQSADDFFMELYAKYDSFGFQDKEKVPLIEIKKKKRDLGVGSRFWIKDEDHIVIFGPQYYLAERQ